MAAVQRFSTLLLVLAANSVVTTTNLRARMLKRYFFWNRKFQNKLITVPVGSSFPSYNFPSLNGSKNDLREKWGVQDKSLVLSSFGNYKIVETFDWLFVALEATINYSPDVNLLLIGCDINWIPLNHPLRTIKGVICTGSCTPLEVVELLKISDIFLLPYEDGVSARRTSLMAGLEYGLPTVTTKGSTTEATFVKDLPVLLADIDSKKDFSDKVVELASNEIKRKLLGEAAAAYFQQNFTCQKIVEDHLPLFSK